MTKNDQNDPDQQFLRDVSMIWIKTASSASIVATAMIIVLYDLGGGC